MIENIREQQVLIVNNLLETEILEEVNEDLMDDGVNVDLSLEDKVSAILGWCGISLHETSHREIYDEIIIVKAYLNIFQLSYDDITTLADYLDMDSFNTLDIEDKLQIILSHNSPDFPESFNYNYTVSQDSYDRIMSLIKKEVINIDTLSKTIKELYGTSAVYVLYKHVFNTGINKGKELYNFIRKNGVSIDIEKSIIAILSNDTSSLSGDDIETYDKILFEVSL